MAAQIGAVIRDADAMLSAVMFGPPPSIDEYGLRFITCCGVMAGDGRMYRAVLYQDKEDELYLVTSVDFPEEYQPSFATGQGETVSAAKAALAESINDIMRD